MTDRGPLRRGVLEGFARLHRTHFARYSIISVDPPIFHVQPSLDMLVDDLLPSYHVLFSALRGRKAYCLLRHSCALTPAVFDWIHQLERRTRQQFPDIELIHLCNRPGQAELFHARGGRAIFCNVNCFVDESVFRPLPSVEKRFDAVYNARLDKVKRHFLAREIASLALIYNPTDVGLEYIRETQRQFSYARFFNHSDSGEYRILRPEEINESLNACRVGLCLSEHEGPMSASVEYLLSGLPIVTTPSLGGRDVFFEESFVVTVAPEPGAIKESVRELIGRKVRPGIPREATLAKFSAHRQAFVALVQEIYDQHDIKRRFADEWPRVFFHRMLANQSHFDTITKLGHARRESHQGHNPDE